MVTANQNAVIQGTGNNGNFVLQGQTLATKQGFGHVSKLWYDKTLSIDSGLEKLSAGVSDREDIIGKFKYVKPVAKGNVLTLEYIDGRSFIPTRHALLQYGTWCNIPHTFINAMLDNPVKQNGKEKFVRDTLDAETLEHVFLNGYRRVDPDKSFLFRTYKDGTLRAVMTEGYSRVDNRWYLELIKSVMPEARLSHWKGDSDTIYGNILIPDTIRKEADSDYGGMFNVGNCEIGKRPIFQLPSVFRAICMNGTIWDQTKGTILHHVHKGIKLDDMAAAIIANINDQIPLLGDGIDKFLALHKVDVSDIKLTNLFGQIVMENGLTSVQAAAILDAYLHSGEAKDKTGFAVVNALTRAGQTFDNESWFKMDSYAGNLVNFSQRDWSGLKARANGLSPEKVSKLFAVAV